MSTLDKGIEVGAKRRKMSPLARKEAIIGYLFVAPWVIGFLVFLAYPMLSSLYYSFTNYNMARTADWVGLTNYRIFFTSDRIVPIAVYNTLYFAVISVPLNMVIGISVAILMNQKIKGINFIRTIYYLPNVVSIVAVVILWQLIFQNNFGIINTLLRNIGIAGPNWLTDPDWAKNALIIMNSWNAGAAMIIYLAGLQGIPSTYYEAAMIDGAGAFRKFFSITIPLLSPAIFFNFIMGIIGALQVFLPAFMMTDGGPLNATTFYVFHLFRMAFNNHRMGYASAMAWMLLVVTLILTLLIFRFIGRKVYYETQ